MARLVNELSWSRSRIATLQTCRRQYYYQYYQKWEGWSWDAGEDARKAYFFSKMTNLSMLCGNVVHAMIKRLLEDVRAGRPAVSDPGLEARKELTRVWRDAEEKRWESSLKAHPPVFELYYPDSRPQPRDLKIVGARAARCVENFVASPLYAELTRDDHARWLAVDDGPSFDDANKLKLDGRTLWALPDFARRTADGFCEIWDWKTGRPNPNDRLQLLSYALFARDRWGFDADRIRLFGFYLDEKRVGSHPCDAPALAEIEERVRGDFVTMIELLEDAEANRPRSRDEHFPMLDDVAVCRRCVYRELCER